jgi:hypothetical protein
MGEYMTTETRAGLITDLLHDLSEEKLMATIGAILRKIGITKPLKLDPVDDSREAWIEAFLWKLSVPGLKDFRKIADGLHLKQ